MSEKLYRDPNWLHKIYWEQEKTLREMAEIAGCDSRTIQRWMEKLGIPRRETATATAEANRRKAQDPAWQKVQAEGAHRMAQDPAWQKATAEANRHINRRLALKKRNQGQMTGIEAICFTAFDSLGLDFIFEKFIYPYRVDFFFPSHGIIVEAMGEHWHGTVKRQRKDAERKAFLEASDYTVLEWWEPDIKADVWKLIDEELLPLLDQPSRIERPPRGVCKPYKSKHGWKSAIQLYLFGKEQKE